MTSDPRTSDRAVSDVHAGATAVDVCNALQAATTDVIAACRDLALRPTSVAVHTRFGLLSVIVTFPSNSPADVDALADRYRLPKELLPVTGAATSFLYERRGMVELASGPASLTASTTRPGVEPPPAAAAVAVPEPVAAVGGAAA